MKKKTTILTAALLLLMALLIPTNAIRAGAEETSAQKAEQELSSAIEEILSAIDWAELQDYLDTLSSFGGVSIRDRIRSVIDGDLSLDYPSLGKAILALFGEEICALVPIFATILTIAVLVGLLNCAKNGFLHSNMSGMINTICYLAIGCVVLALLNKSFFMGLSCLQALKEQMEIVFPMLMTLMAASGGSVSVAVFRPGIAFLSGMLVELFTRVVLPMNIVCIVLTFADRLSPDVRCAKLGDLFRSMNKWLIGFTLALFGIMLSVQGISSAQYDGLSLRAVKYLISGSVPLVGGFLSGSVDFILAGTTLIRNALGAFSVLMLFAVILRPLIYFICIQLMLRLAAAAAEPVCEEVPVFLSSLARDMGYLIAGLLTIAFLYFLTLLLLVCSAGVFL